MTNLLRKRTQPNDQEESQWLSISDLMAALMMVFLFIAVALMRQAYIDNEKIREVAITYSETQVAIHDALMREFESDLEHWDAKIDKDLTFNFQSPDVLFATGSAQLTPNFQTLLENFFPRYLAVLKPFDKSISEVRIEGHTSSDWDNLAPTQAYFRNMVLSQERTRTVLEYAYGLDQVALDQDWIKGNVAAVGFSSSRLKYIDDDPTLGEDVMSSKRVSFRVMTNADIQIKKILEM
ncbi:OmpA/MotB family protein [Thiomicrospira microaerophila]|uniref:OmpA/MotB family protein n=1 Tax=Thiomicrospira microaerophila TaxID=406020 RepID=UPI0005CAAE9F|nr:OmpA family protein [Thiomicrospira microaerophila]